MERTWRLVAVNLTGEGGSCKRSTGGSVGEWIGKGGRNRKEGRMTRKGGPIQKEDGDDGEDEEMGKKIKNEKK